MMQLANSTFYMSGTEARLSPHSGSNSSGGPATATVHRLRKADSGRGMTESRNSGSSITTAAEEEVSPDETGGQSSSSAPISPTLSPSSRLMLKRKQLNASVALRSPLFSSSSACSTSSSAASSLVSFGSSSKTNSLKRSAADENLASRLRNLQISELIDAIFLVEGKLKKEQKMIAKELRSRDLQISQQLKEIERYRQERKLNLCGFCQRKMDNVNGGEKGTKKDSCDRVTGTDQRSVEVQTEEVTGFKGVLRLARQQQHQRQSGVQEEEEEARQPAGGDEEILDDWYANGNSDNENEKSRSPVNLYERGVNPVLERVNQILLQESMDASTEDAEAMVQTHAAAVAAEVARQTAAAAPTTALVTKRVQFSTALLPPSTTTAAQLQQQLQVKVAERMQTTRIPEIRKVPPIGKCAPIPIVKQLPPPPLNSLHAHPQQLIMRVHPSPKRLENEYEVIGSEQDSSNYYVDMQSPDPKAFLRPPQSGTGVAAAGGADEVEYKNVLTRKEGLELLRLIAPHPGMPPALPPKPANLMKFKKVVPLVMKNIRAQNGAGIVPATDPKGGTAIEPDYCSISECGANNSSTISSSKSVPRDLDDDMEETASRASEDTLENLPKLPNVAAIIVPKKHHSQQSQQLAQAPVNMNAGGNGSIHNAQNMVGGGGGMAGGGVGSINANKSNNIVINKDNYITKTVMSLKSTPSAHHVHSVTSPAKVKENIGFVAASMAGLKDLPPISGHDNNKRFHSSPMRASLSSSIAEQRQHMIHRLSHDAQQQHSHHGMMMKRYSMDALSPHIQPEEGKGGGGLFEERIPIQAEFDWYNLDAEFGKFNAQDVIKEAKSSGSESGSVSGGEEEKRPAKVSLERGLSELREIERKMSTIERKRSNNERKDANGNKEMVHFC